VKVLVIPEDPMLDQYILKPVVERLFADLGLATLIEVLWNPRLRSVNQALDASVVRHIVDTYSMIDLFLLIVDRDADEHRTNRVRMRETEHPGRLLACLAVEEVEVWMLHSTATDCHHRGRRSAASVIRKSVSRIRSSRRTHRSSMPARAANGRCAISVLAGGGYSTYVPRLRS
jgi:hypothetical protein